MEKLDLRKYGLPDTYAQQQGKKGVPTVQARRSKKDEWLMVNGDPEMCLQMAAVVNTPDFSTYLVEPSLVPRLNDADYQIVNLYTAITSRGGVFVLPAKVNATDAYSESLRAGIDAAKAGWVRIAANKDLGMYDVFMPTSELPPPVWPEELTFDRILDMAFKNKVIDSWNHPVLKGLRGEF